MTDRSIVFLKKKDPLRGKTREEIIQEFRSRLSGRVENAYFFGGFAENRMRDRSDIDIMIVKETDTPFTMRMREFDDLWTITPAIDLLVYTPDEFRSLTEDPAPGFWREVTRTMIRFL